MTIAAHPDPSVRIRWACRRLTAAGPVPARPSLGYPDGRHQRSLPSRHLRAPAATDSPWSQMWSHSPAFIGVRRGLPERQSARHGRSRPAANAGVQTWKACWGQPLRSSNLLSSAMLTCKNTVHRGRPQGASSCAGLICGLTFGRWKVPSAAYAALFCQVTGMQRPEQRGARRETCAPPFRAGRDRPRPGCRLLLRGADTANLQTASHCVIGKFEENARRPADLDGKPTCGKASFTATEQGHLCAAVRDPHRRPVPDSA